MEPFPVKKERRSTRVPKVLSINVYCYCRCPYNGEKMVKCNGECDEWYHIKCICIPIINPRRACAARVTVCPSVRLSGTPYSATTRNKAAKKRYQRVQYHTVLIFKIAIFVKVLRSRVMP